MSTQEVKTRQNVAQAFQYHLDLNGIGTYETEWRDYFDWGWNAALVSVELLAVKTRTREEAEALLDEQSWECPHGAVIRKWDVLVDALTGLPIESTSNRFEVGQPCQVFDHQKGEWIKGAFGASDEPGIAGTVVTFWSDPADVRPAPKTVELTDDEKLDALIESPKAPTSNRILRLIVGGKTLDELCREYGIETVRRVV